MIVPPLPPFPTLFAAHVPRRSERVLLAMIAAGNSFVAYTLITNDTMIQGLWAWPVVFVLSALTVGGWVLRPQSRMLYALSGSFTVAAFLARSYALFLVAQDTTGPISGSLWVGSCQWGMGALLAGIAWGRLRPTPAGR